MLLARAVNIRCDRYCSNFLEIKVKLNKGLYNFLISWNYSGCHPGEPNGPKRVTNRLMAFFHKSVGYDSTTLGCYHLPTIYPTSLLRSFGQPAGTGARSRSRENRVKRATFPWILRTPESWAGPANRILMLGARAPTRDSDGLAELDSHRWLAKQWRFVWFRRQCVAHARTSRALVCCKTATRRRLNE